MEDVLLVKVKVLEVSRHSPEVIMHPPEYLIMLDGLRRGWLDRDVHN
jgi:hypothetical protein